MVNDIVFIFPVVKDPPYFVEQSGYGGFVLPVEIYFRNKEDPKKVQFNYDLFLPAIGLAPINNIRSEALTFTNPTEEFKRKLLKGGGIIIENGLNGFHRLVNIIQIQSNLAILNSVNSKSPPFQSQADSPLFDGHLVHSNLFSCPVGLQNSRVQLYNYL